MDSLLGFTLAAFALAGSPGPATLSLAATGAAFGARRGLAFLAGLMLGMLVVMGVAATGAIGLLMAVPGATPLVAGFAAVYFLYLAYRIATAPPLQDGAEEGRQPSFAGGLVLSLVNPKGYAAMAALFSGFVLLRGHPALDAIAKIGLLTAIIAAVDVAWLFAGAALARRFRDPRASRVINVAFAVLLVLSIGFLWI